VCIQLFTEMHLKAVNVIHHMGSHSDTCHLTQMNMPHLNRSLNLPTLHG